MKMVDYLFCVLFQFLYQFRICNPYRLTAFDILTVYVLCNHRKHILKKKHCFTVPKSEIVRTLCVLIIDFQIRVFEVLY